MRSSRFLTTSPKPLFLNPNAILVERLFNMFDGLALTSASAIALLLVMIFAGRAFRENWKAQAQGWTSRAWLYGLPATLAFFALALIPLNGG